MREVIRSIVVCEHDGTEHPSKADALRHLDKQYGDLITQLAREIIAIAQAGKPYVPMTDWLDQECTKRLATLARIHDDMDTFIEAERDNDE